MDYIDELMPSFTDLLKKQQEKKDELKAYQLKDVLRLYIEKENPEEKIFYKSKNKKDLYEIIKKLKINLNDYKDKVIKELPSKNILEKYNKEPYKEEKQKDFLKEEEEKDLSALVPRKKYIDIKLQNHQIDFIKQFIYSNLQGAIMFHGVGSGKTLTAVVSAYWYLKLYPNNKVIVISPSALIYNFIEGMQQYGLEISDNRYSFITYEKYSRMSIKNKTAINTLVIVDEAHNIRTEMKIKNEYDPNNIEKVIGQTATQNKRGFNIWNYGALNAHKILLLTGTAMVNCIYDIENLLACIDKRQPLEKKTFDNALGSPSNITDYFSYRISYVASPKSEFFPERREKLIYLEMSEEVEKEYSRYQQNGPAKNAFLIDERRASNSLMDTGKTMNPKIKWCIDTIKKNKTQKFIIYAGLYVNGVEFLEKALKKNKLEYVKITGKDSAKNKQIAKEIYNNSIIGRPTNPTYEQKIKLITNENLPSDIRILLISKAGAEGVDTKNTQNIIILDHQWNDALSEQIIARAIRYKSHFDLPVKERYVNVYRLFLCPKDSKGLFDKVEKGKLDFVKLNSEIKEAVRKQQDLLKMKDETYLPTVKLLKTLKIGETDKLFIPEDTVYEKKRTGFRKKMGMVKTYEGWDEYNLLKTDHERKMWRIRMYSDWFVQYSPDYEKPVQITGAIDLRLYILCKAKQENIDTFISYFQNRIKTFEQYESSFIKKIISLEKNNKISSSVLRTLLKDEKADIKTLLFEKRKRTKEEIFQQYYTNDALAQDIIEMSKIKEDKRPLKILEPSAGDGALIIPLMKLNNVNFNIDAIEIDLDNRKKLETVFKGRTCVKLNTHRNFLTYTSGAIYDYIFMNPPFHLRKSENASMIRDIYDFDFVERAYAMLKVGGTLVAIIGNSWKTVDEKLTTWIRGICKPKILKPEKYSGNVIVHNTYTLKIVKKNNTNDNIILDYNFFKTTDKTEKIGEEINNAIYPLHNLKEEKTEKIILVEKPRVEKKNEVQRRY